MEYLCREGSDAEADPGNRCQWWIFMSGDVHWGEISRESKGVDYPIYDITSSGLTQIHDWASSNKKRLEV